MTLLRRARDLLLGEVGIIFAVGIGTPLLARQLSLSEFGNYAFVLSAFGVANVLVSSGIHDSFRQRISTATDTEEKAVEFVNLFFTAQFVALLGAVGLVGIAWFTPDLALPLVLTAILLVMRSAFDAIRSAEMACEYELANSSLRTGRRVTMYAVAVLAASLGFGVSGIFISFSVATAIFVGLGCVDISRKLSLWENLTWPSVPVRDVLVQTAPIYIHTISAGLMWHFDILLIKEFVDSTAAGYYKSALTISQFLWQAPMIVQTLLVYSTAELWKEDDLEGLTNEITGLTRLTLVVTVLLGVGIASLASPFVELYFGPKYLPAVPALLILIPGCVGYAVARPLIGTSLARRRPWGTVVVTVGIAVLNIGLNVVLIPEYGILGAAVATSISYGLLLPGHLFVLSHLDVRIISRFPMANVLVGTGLGAAWIWILAEVVPRSLALLVVPTLGGIGFLSAVYFTDAVAREDLEDLIP